jgi:hypothetical protein
MLRKDVCDFDVERSITRKAPHPREKADWNHATTASPRTSHYRLIGADGSADQGDGG